MTDIHNGSCLCGAVRFTTNGPLRGVVFCHCSQCRKQTGYCYAATNVAVDKLGAEGADGVGGSDAWFLARRGFCRTCGSALFWKPREGAYTSVLAGLFDPPSGLEGECHIFVADKGDFYEIADELPQFEQSTPAVKVAQS